MKCKTKNAGAWLIRIVIVLLAGIFLFAAYQIFSYWQAENETKQLAEELIEKAVLVPSETPESSLEPTAGSPMEETAPIEVDFERLWQENEDIVAWIYCPDTPIHYPVVQSTDNSYYLRRLLNGSYNVNGTIFLDYRCASDFSGFNSILYGHHMKSGEMFGTLPNYKDQAYYEEHPVIYLLTPDQNYKVELIAGYITPSDSDTYVLPVTGEDRRAFLEHAAAESVFSSDVAFQETDSFLTLSTCSYEYDNARFVVVGRLAEIQ